jgi:hypothetical protein
VKFNLLDAARHEPLRLPTPSFSLDAGFQSCTLAPTHLAPGDIHPKAFLSNFWIVPDGFFDVQFIHIRRFDGGFDLAVCLKFQIAW